MGLLAFEGGDIYFMTIHWLSFFSVVFLIIPPRDASLLRSLGQCGCGLIVDLYWFDYSSPVPLPVAPLPSRDCFLLPNLL